MPREPTVNKKPFTIIDWGKAPRPIFERVIAYLQMRVDDARRTGERLCAVFDVDETLICSQPSLANGNDDDDDSDEVRWARHPFGWALYQWCVAHGICIRIVTAREATPSNVKFTIEQLRMSGYGNGYISSTPTLIGDAHNGDVQDWRATRVYMHPDCEPDVAAAKHAARRTLVQEGETIVLCVGDQITDHIAPTCHAMRAHLKQRFHPGAYYCMTCHRDDLERGLCVKTPEDYCGWQNKI